MSHIFMHFISYINTTKVLLTINDNAHKAAVAKDLDVKETLAMGPRRISSKDPKYVQVLVDPDLEWIDFLELTVNARKHERTITYLDECIQMIALWFVLVRFDSFFWC